jgi:hypothetical protein
MELKKLRSNHKELYNLLVQLNKTEEKPLEIGLIPEDGANYLLSISSDLTQRSFVMVQYNDHTEIIDEEIKNTQSVEALTFLTVSIPVNTVLEYLSVIIKEYSKNSQLMIMIRRNHSGSIFNEHIRRLYRQEDNIQLFPTAKYSESGEIVIDKIGHGWKQTKTDEELCQDCMKDSLLNRYFLLSSKKSEGVFELLRYKDPKEKDSKDKFWLTWGMIAFVRHNKLKIFNDENFDELEYDYEKFSRKVSVGSNEVSGRYNNRILPSVYGR